MIQGEHLVDNVAHLHHRSLVDYHTPHLQQIVLGVGIELSVNYLVFQRGVIYIRIALQWSAVAELSCFGATQIYCLGLGNCEVIVAVVPLNVQHSMLD
jgi:hypothetical protein